MLSKTILTQTSRSEVTPPMPGPVTQAWMRFIDPSSIPEGEKAYELEYKPTTDDLRSKNYELRTVSDIPIFDMRTIRDSLSLDDQGFIVAELKTPMSYEDYFDEVRLRTVFAKDVRDLVLKTVGGKAKAAFIHECVIRQRSNVAPSENQGFGKPIPIAHTDYTMDYIRRLVQQLFKDDRQRLDGRRTQMINIWKPLRGPLRDWPLALCDLRSIRRHEYIALDEVHESDILESQQIVYNSNQKWYYLSDQQADEVLIFKSADSHVPGEVPHGSFEDPRFPNEHLSRESIECRVLVVY